MADNTIPALVERAKEHWDSAEIVGTIGMELESRTRLPLARTFLKRAIELNPKGNPEWYISLAFANFRDNAKLAEDGEIAFIDGLEATDSDFLKASYIGFLESEEDALLLMKVVAKSADVSVQFALSHSFLWRGDGDSALELARTAIARVPEGELPLGVNLYCATMIWLAGQGAAVRLAEEVEPYLNRLISAEPDTYFPRALKIQMFQTLKNWDKTRQTCVETLENFPDEETTMFALGVALQKLGHVEEAIAWFKKAIAAKPEYVRPRITLGRHFEPLGNMEEAERYFREIPIANPDYRLGTLETAYFLHRRGQTDAALALFRKTYPALKPFEKGGVGMRAEGKELLEKSGL